MKRRLLLPERIICGDGKTPFNVAFSLRIAGRVTPEGLANALQKVQARHPILSVSVWMDEKNVPFFISRKDIPSIPVRRVERRHGNDWLRELKTELSAAFDVFRQPLFRVVWVRSEDISELILTFHHCMCDGRGGIIVMQEILMLLDQPEKTLTPYPPFCSLRELIPSHLLHSRKNRLKATLMPVLSRVAFSAVSAFTPVGNRERLDRKRDYLIHWKLDRSASLAFFKRCTQEGVTVNTALCVAILSAFQEVREKAFRNKIACPVDIRRFMPEIKKDRIFSYGLALTLSIIADRHTGFWAKANNLQGVVSRKTACLNAYAFVMNLEHFHASVSAIRKILTYGKVGTPDLMFSNLGRLDVQRHYRYFEVDNVYSPVSVGPYGNPNSIITSTYNDQMDFSFISNNAYLTYEHAEAIKNKAMELLLDRNIVPQAGGNGHPHKAIMEYAIIR